MLALIYQRILNPPEAVCDETHDEQSDDRLQAPTQMLTTANMTVRNGKCVTVHPLICAAVQILQRQSFSPTGLAVRALKLIGFSLSAR